MNHRPVYNETELLAALAIGSEAAFTDIYHHYSAAIYTYLIGYVKVPFLAEDLVHEVFIKLWEKRADLDIKKSFSAYLYRISHNKALDALKKISSDTAFRKEMAYWMEPQFTGEASAIGRAEYYEQLLENAVAALPPQGRNVFTLCREQGKTYEEAAQLLGISRNTVKEHMVNAMRILRKHLSGAGELTFLLLIAKKLF